MNTFNHSASNLQSVFVDDARALRAVCFRKSTHVVIGQLFELAVLVFRRRGQEDARAAPPGLLSPSCLPSQLNQSVEGTP